MLIKNAAERQSAGETAFRFYISPDYTTCCLSGQIQRRKQAFTIIGSGSIAVFGWAQVPHGQLPANCGLSAIRLDCPIAVIRNASYFQLCFPTTSNEKIMRATEHAFFVVLFSAVGCRAATVGPVSDEFAVLQAVSHDYCASKDFHYGKLLATAARMGRDPLDDARLQGDLSARLGDATNHHLVDRLFITDSPPASLPVDVDYACLFLMDPKEMDFVGRSKQKYESKKTFPGIWGQFQISLPAFSMDHDSALVYFTYTFGGLAGRAQVIVLKRSVKGWSVIDRLLLAVE